MLVSCVQKSESVIHMHTQYIYPLFLRLFSHIEHCRVLNSIHFILFFNFTVLYCFCHISTWIRHRYTRVPHPEPRSHLPPCTIAQGHPSAPAPSILYWNLDWDSFLIWYYTCFNAIFLIHPRILFSFTSNYSMELPLKKKVCLPLSQECKSGPYCLGSRPRSSIYCVQL